MARGMVQAKEYTVVQTIERDSNKTNVFKLQRMVQTKKRMEKHVFRDTYGIKTLCSHVSSLSYIYI
jgi:hypothetical protein